MVSLSVSRTLRWMAGIQDDEEERQQPAPSYAAPFQDTYEPDPAPASYSPPEATSSQQQPAEPEQSWVQRAIAGLPTLADVGSGISSAAQAVSDAYAVPEEQRPPAYSGPSYAQPSLAPDQPSVPQRIAAYATPTETEVGAVRSGIEATQAAEPVGPEILPEPVRRAAGAGLGALQTVQAASDAVKARIDPRVWGFAKDGIAREILSPDELARWTQLGSAALPDGTPKSYADYQAEQAESQTYTDRVEARYQQIKDDPDALTRYANASPAYGATSAVTDAALAPAVGALASGAARTGALALGAGARTARAAGYAADVAGQSLVDPTSLPLQPAADLAVQGVRGLRGAARVGADRFGSVLADAAPSPAAADALAAPGVQQLGSGVVPEAGAAATQRAADIAASGGPASSVKKYQALGAAGADTPEDLAERLRTVPVVTAEQARQMLGDRPDYLGPVADFLVEQRGKALNGQMTARDVAKAYYMTLMSMRSSAQEAGALEQKLGRGFTTGAGEVIPPNPELARLDQMVNVNNGTPLGDIFAEANPRTGGRIVRPESMGAAWLWTDEGQRALNGMSEGEFIPEAWERGRHARLAFGSDTVGGNGAFRPLTEAELRAGKVNMTNLPAFVDELNTGIQRMRDEGKEIGEIGAWLTDQVKRLNGIAVGKSAFIKQLLGFGDAVTIDAREINYWLSGRGLLRPGDTSQGAQMARAASQWWDNRNVSGALQPRIQQEVMRLHETYPELVEGLDPNDAAHLLHHWIWDKAGGSTTRHTDVMASQQLAAGAAPQAGRGLRPDLYNAAQGGVMGAVSEDLQAQQEGREADPAERARRALIGGGLAVAGGRYARPAAAGAARLGAGVVPTPPAQATRAAQSANPHIANTARQMAGQYTPSGIAPRPMSERIVAALTDKHAIVGNVEQEISGRIAAAGGQAPATRLAERVRENPNSIAAQRAREELAPAIQSVGEDTDWLEQVLVHAHNADVAAAKGQEAYDAAIAAGRTTQQAQAVGNRVRQSRMFSGGMTEADIVQALSDIQTDLGPARWQTVLNAAQAFWDTGRRSLDEKLAEGMVSPAVHGELTARYPHYVRTDIADYFEAGPAAPSPGGRTMGVSNVGIKAIDAVGTSKDRVNPVLSTIDALYSHEAAVTRNAAAQDLVQLRDADPTARALFKEVAPDAQAFRGNRADMVPPDYSLRGGEQKLTAWENGEPRQFIIPAEYAALLSPRQGALLGDSALAQGTRNFFGLWKSLITTHNPAFQMVVSPLRDVGDYAVGEATRSASKGGVRGMAQAAGALPGVLADYVKALPAAFEGLGQGRVGQEVADLRRAGAGFEGRPQRTDAGLREVYRDLQSSGGMAIRSPQDAARAARTVLTLGAEPIGSRLEMVPRIAAARRAAGRGADELGQAMAFKDATIDFLRGGWLTQQLNVPVPFINPTVQSSAQVVRLAQKNPTAFAAAVGSAIGVPAMLAEAWNRSDEQRAADYANVPDSVKNTGIVWMLPDEVAGQQLSGTSDLGERKPNYLWVPLGSFAVAARMAREGLGLADPVTGLESRPERPGRRVESAGDAALRALEIGTEILGTFSPVKGEGFGSSVASLIPPVASEAVETWVNKDLYRGSTIATDRRDEQASRLSHAGADALNTVMNTDQVRPSQVEHWVRGVGGYAGQLATAASDLGRDRGETRPIQDTPIAGGLASRVVRDTGGQRLEDATTIEARAPEAIRSVLAEAGMRSDQVQPVGSTYLGGPLTRAEQLAWQQATNALVETYVQDAVGSSKWDDPTTRQAAVTAAVTKARADAAKEVELPSRSEMRERAQERQQRRAG